MKRPARVVQAGQPEIQVGYAFPLVPTEIYFDIEDDPTQDVTYLTLIEASSSAYGVRMLGGGNQPERRRPRFARLTGFSWRDVDPGGANSIAWYNEYLSAVGPERASERARLLQRILDYNEDDCKATEHIRDWFVGRER